VGKSSAFLALHERGKVLWWEQQARHYEICGARQRHRILTENGVNEIRFLLGSSEERGVQELLCGGSNGKENGRKRRIDQRAARERASTVKPGISVGPWSAYLLDGSLTKQLSTISLNDFEYLNAPPCRSSEGGSS
jgi:hypothetical protein